MSIFNKIKNFLDLPQCPHCGTILDPPPSRKKKCLNCGKYIFVRQNPYDTRRKFYVNEDTAHCIDLLSDVGIDEASFNEASKRGELLGDTIWGLVSAEKHEAARRNDWGRISNIAFSQAMYYRMTGRKYYSALQEAHKAKLINNKGSVTSFV